MTKNEIRNKIIKMRSNISQVEVDDKSKKCVEIIKEHPRFKESHVIGLFHPIHNELNLLKLCQDEHKIFCFPKVEPTGLVFYEVEQDTKFVKSPFGVLEPHNGKACNVIDFMLVPALAISKELYRIGYGKAYYDRYLHKNRPQHVIGVIYDFQEIESFEIDQHDQKLDDYIKV